MQYKDKLSAEKYMLWTPNGDAISDCALRKHREIMRQKDRGWEKSSEGRGAGKRASSPATAPHFCLLPLAGSP